KLVTGVQTCALPIFPRCPAGPVSLSAGWRCTGGTPRNCWPRNCAGWTRTRSTPRPSSPSSARPRWPRPSESRSSAAPPSRPPLGWRGAVSTTEVLVHHDASLLAKAAAARLVTRLVDAQASGGTADLVLTGGGIGTALLSELAAAPARDAVVWRRLGIWWGDERFLPAGHPDRNETQAAQALLRHI